MAFMEPLLRRTWREEELLAAHPPKLGNPHKQWAYERVQEAGGAGGEVELSRWDAAALPQGLPGGPVPVELEARFFAYDRPWEGVWHVNFADPQLFVAYGSSLLAQDELQALEHPVLGALREALLAEGQKAVTEENGRPTPVLVVGAARRCELATNPDPRAGRPRGLYGNEFARASREAVADALRVLQPPTRTNLLAMAAPVSRAGPYWRRHIEQALVTAFTGFSAVVQESRRRWPDARVEIHTGFWGCGAFGGSRPLMTCLQLLAARLSGVDVVHFHAVGADGARDFEAGQATLEQVTAGATTVAEVIDRLDDLDFEWSGGDGT